MGVRTRSHFGEDDDVSLARDNSVTRWSVTLARSEGGESSISTRQKCDWTPVSPRNYNGDYWLMIENCPDDLANGLYVQSVDAMRKAATVNDNNANRLVFAILDC